MLKVSIGNSLDVDLVDLDDAGPPNMPGALGPGLLGSLGAVDIEFHSRGAVTANDLDLKAVLCRGHTIDLDLGEGPHMFKTQVFNKPH